MVDKCRVKHGDVPFGTFVPDFVISLNEKYVSTPHNSLEPKWEKFCIHLHFFVLISLSCVVESSGLVTYEKKRSYDQL